MLWAIIHEFLKVSSQNQKARAYSSSVVSRSSDTNVRPSSFPSLLRWCAREKAFLVGKQAHHELIVSGLERNTFLANLLLHMYFSWGALADGSSLFSLMPVTNEFTWRIIIVDLVHHGDIEGAFHRLAEMQSTEIVPDRLTFIAIVTACSTGGPTYLSTGQKVHYLTLMYHLDSDVVVLNSLITMYGKANSLADAQSTFDGMGSHDLVSWNALITAYANKGQCDDALDLFKRMDEDGLRPDNFTFMGVITAITNPSALAVGIHIHNLIQDSKWKSDMSLSNALINMYGRCASLKGAKETFDAMAERNIISWTAMLAVHAEHGKGSQAYQLFEQLHQECVMPNSVTFVTYLDTCSKQQALAVGKQLHARISGSQSDGEVMVGTALVNMYGKCGKVKMSRRIFDNMLRRSVVSWGTMIATYAHHAVFKEALQLVQQMQQEGDLPDRVILISMLDACASQPALQEGKRVHACVTSSRIHLDIPLSTALVRMYGESGQLKDAEDVFNRMPDRNILSWNALMSGYLHNEEGQLTLDSLNRMQQESLLPGEVTFVNGFSACGAEMDLESGRQLHASFWGSEFQSDVFLWNALISMYGRGSNVEEARRVFDEMPTCNTVSWNAVTTAYAQNGCTEEALYLFNKMQRYGVPFEKATFGVILSACSHGGCVNEAFYLFSTMRQKYGMKPALDHYNCILDLLARAGRLDDAEAFLQRMPCEVDYVSLITLLGACRHQKDLHLGEQIARQALLLDPGNTAPSIVLASIYASIVSGEVDHQR